MLPQLTSQTVENLHFKMECQQPLLSDDNGSPISLRKDNNKTEIEMGTLHSRASNRITDLSWSFPSLTMDEIVNLKKTYDALAMLSPRDSLISKATFMHYFKLGAMMGGRFFNLLDKDGDGKINLTEFLDGLSICIHGSFDEKSRLLFNMFDINGDDFVCEEDLMVMLPLLINACKRGTCFSENLIESHCNKGVTIEMDDEPGSIIENLFIRYDRTKMNKLGLDDFCGWVHEYPAFVDAVFQCDFFINFMTPRFSADSHPDMKDIQSVSFKSQTWMEEEIQAEKIMEASKKIHLSNARFLWKPRFPLSVSAQVPGKRYKHSAVLYNGCLYLLGGRGKQSSCKDLWRYRTDDGVWDKLQIKGPSLSALIEHTAVRYKNLMYVFGGEVVSDGGTPLWYLDLDTLRRVDLPKTKHGPTNRRSHTAVLYRDSMYVFGGYSDIGGSTNELWRYDFATGQWVLLKPQHSQNKTIPERYAHSAVVINNAMWIFGGYEKLQRKNELWRWDFDLSFWSKIKCRQGPPPLSGHSMVKVGGCIVIFGGDSNDGLSNKIWRYSFDDYKWFEVAAYGGISPPVRTFQTVAVLSPFQICKKRNKTQRSDIKESSLHSDRFVRNIPGSKRSFSSKSNSADDILLDKDIYRGHSLSDTSSTGKNLRPHSVVDQVCHNLKNLDKLTPVEITDNDPTQFSILQSQNRSREFQIEEYPSTSDTSVYSYTQRHCWSLILVGGKCEESVDLLKTSVDVWQCDIGDVSDGQNKSDLLSSVLESGTYDRFDRPPTVMKSSKRKHLSYEKLEVTDISDEDYTEGSPEQKPKLQESRNLLAH